MKTTEPLCVVARVLLLACGLGLGPSALAQSAAPAPDPLSSVPQADPLELAALTARMGDDAVLQRLALHNPTELRLMAVRATVFLRAPELALWPLAEIAASRDPELAPAAARRALAIAESLARSGLQRREIEPASLVPARARLLQVASAAQVRPDLRALAAQAAQLLATLGVPDSAAGGSH